MGWATVRVMFGLLGSYLERHQAEHLQLIAKLCAEMSGQPKHMLLWFRYMYAHQLQLHG